MSHPPIFFAATQIAFNEIREMEKFVDSIQEQMRINGYTDFSRNNVKTVQFNAASPDANLQQTQTVRWQFLNFEKTAGYSLTPNLLFFQTTAYETSDELRAALLQGIEIVHKIVGLEYVQSISLRTLDAIIPRPHEDISTYLKPNLIGFSKTFQGNLRQSTSEAVTQKENGILVTRAVILGPETPGLGVPFDLYPIQLQMSDRFLKVKGLHAILDNDRIDQDRFKFDLAQIANRFIAIKKDISQAFDSAVTEEALLIWK